MGLWRKCYGRFLALLACIITVACKAAPLPSSGNPLIICYELQCLCVLQKLALSKLNCGPSLQTKTRAAITDDKHPIAIIFYPITSH